MNYFGLRVTMNTEYTILHFAPISDILLNCNNLMFALCLFSFIGYYFFFIKTYFINIDNALLVSNHL